MFDGGIISRNLLLILLHLKLVLLLLTLSLPLGRIEVQLALGEGSRALPKTVPNTGLSVRGQRLQRDGCGAICRR